MDGKKHTKSQMVVVVSVEQLVERMAGVTQVLWENLPKCRFVPQPDPGHRVWEASN
jgi:hypothetical protein